MAATQPPMLYVNFADTIEIEPQLPGYEEAGPEPSLIALVRAYYVRGLPDHSDLQIEELVIQYFNALRNS